MKIRNTQVQSGKVFSFGFKGLQTDTLYYACYYEQTSMVVIYKTKPGLKLNSSEEIIIDRWMSYDKFQEKVDSGYIEPKFDSNGNLIYSTENEVNHFDVALKRYANAFPLVLQCY